VRELVLAAVCGLAKRLDLFQLLAPKFVDVVVECQEEVLCQGIAPCGAETMERRNAIINNLPLDVDPDGGTGNLLQRTYVL
jgi:hypothetical protein